MERRHDDHWYSTRDTAFSLYGLIRYLHNSNELHPDLDAQVTVNGKVLLTQHIGQQAVAQPAITIMLEKEQLPPGPLNVVITRSGTGKLYYTATLEETVSDNLSMPAAGTPDINITRSYRPVVLQSITKNSRNKVKPSFDYHVGDTIEVTLQIHATHAFADIMVEDPLPAGCEPQDRGSVDMGDWGDWSPSQ
jgi:uncharacterized protein YfaS (alpha-2-macroglobulin family)